MKTYTCDRCNGKGHIRGFSHVQGGICFKCGGSGKVERKPTQPKAPKADLAHIAFWEAKLAKAKELYRTDHRLRVEPESQYYYMHARELAELDGIWETL